MGFLTFSTAGDNQRASLHPPQHTPRLLHYGPCRHHELYRYNPNHVLADLLPEKVNTHYQQDRQLFPKTAKLYSCNFVIRMVYRHSYWLFISILTIVIFTIFLLYKLRFDKMMVMIKDGDDDALISLLTKLLTVFQQQWVEFVILCKHWLRDGSGWWTWRKDNFKHWSPV